MKNHSHSLFIAIIICILSLTSGATAQTDSASRLTVGTLVNVDAGAISPEDLSIDQFPLELSDAEISLGWSFQPHLRADANLVHDQGTATLEQAFATWKSTWMDLSMGQQALPLGICANHLIHDPLLIEDVETIVPSILLAGSLGRLTLQGSVANQEYQPSWEEDSLAGPPSVTFPLAVGAMDVSWGEANQVRLSTLVSHHRRILDLSTTIALGQVSVDLEGLAAEGAWALSDLAGLAAVSWKPLESLESLELATRLDARKTHGESSWTRVVGTGATYRFATLAHTGAEWMHEIGKGDALTLRLGLEGHFQTL